MAGVQNGHVAVLGVRYIDRLIAVSRRTTARAIDLARADPHPMPWQKRPEEIAADEWEVAGGYVQAVIDVIPELSPEELERNGFDARRSDAPGRPDHAHATLARQPRPHETREAPAALMSAWQAAASSTSMAAVEAVSISPDGRHQGDVGPKRATGESMRACTRDRGRQMQTASESRNEGGGWGAPGHGTGRHPSSSTCGECLGHTSRCLGMPHATPGSDCHVPGKRSIFGIAGDRPCMPWLSPHQLPQLLFEVNAIWRIKEVMWCVPISQARTREGAKY